jgi:hypothetical protein
MVSQEALFHGRREGRDNGNAASKPERRRPFWLLQQAQYIQCNPASHRNRLPPIRGGLICVCAATECLVA